MVTLHILLLIRLHGIQGPMTITTSMMTTNRIGQPEL